MRYRLFGVLVILMMAMVVNMLAQDESIDAMDFSLEDLLVVTATKSEQKISDSPSAVSVITQNEIRHSWALDVVDLLRTVPGMDFAMKTYSDPDINIRGFNEDESNKTLVLLDGHPISTPHIGNTMWAQAPLSLLHLEQVEVIRGPGSTLYGANAFSGVVNLRTIPLSERKTEAVLSYGEAGYRRTEAQGVLHHGNFHAAVTLGHIRPERPADPDSDDNESVENWKYKDSSTRNQMFGEAQYLFNNGGEFYLGLSRADTEGGYNSDPGTANIRQTTWKHEIHRMRFTSPLMEGTFTSRLTYYHTNRYNYQPETLPDGGEIDHFVYWWDCKGWRGSTEYERSFGERHQFVLGLEAGRFIDNSTIYIFPPVHPGTEYKDSFTSIYLQDAIKLSGKITTYIGFRYDDWETFGGVSSPRLTFVYKPVEKLSLRFSAGKSYRKAATVYYFYKVEGLEGNPELLPEIADEYEIGARFAVSKKSSFEIASFYKEAEDLIQWVQKSEDLIQTDNIGKVSGYGGEIEYKYRWNDQTSMFVNYSYQSYRDDISDEHFGRAPRHKANAGFQSELPHDFFISATVNYTSKQTGWVAPYNDTVDAGAILNLSLERNLMNDRCTVFVRAFNLLDEERYEVPDFTNLERRISIGIHIRP